LPEIALVRRVLPEAAVHFMHPVKARAAIHAAFTEHGVSDFAFDSLAELAKILQETVPVGLVGAPPTLGLFVRLAVAQGGAYDLSGKFGVSAAEAAELLRAARPHAARLGIAFHVGSQCLDPGAYTEALRVAAEAVARSEVAVDIVDVGGGFPVRRAGPWGAGGRGGAALGESPLLGPPCDGPAGMAGPFLFPADRRGGDGVERGQLGAYGACLRPRFNGFDSALTVEVAAPP